METRVLNFISPSSPEASNFSRDAILLADFERSREQGTSFHYLKSTNSATGHAPEAQISAYLSRIQRGGWVQSFGCMLAVEEPSFKIVAYSENSIDMLDLQDFEEYIHLKGLLGVDARTLFTPPSGDSLTKAITAREISLVNPVWVYLKTTQKPFYAILHRIDVGMVIDLEPSRPGDPVMFIAGAVQSQKLVVRAISRLQSLPGGNIGALCNSVAEDVQQLTGYDRIMVYKFHEDDHGEIVSEVRKSNLEPYLGLHYPATDIPQAARFLFKQNRVRIICDCKSSPVKIIQNEESMPPLCLVNSTLRAPHECHLQYMVNMDSIASLVLAIVINQNNTTRLWGLVVCHHTSPRHVPFPLRHTCELFMQAFGLLLNMELQLATQLEEKKILKTQTLLCDMFLRDTPLGIVSQSPNIMNLVKCNGAALYYGGRCWLLGVTPTEAQIEDLVNWLLTCHGDSTGFSTESLANAGYAGAALFGSAVCGMAAAKISSRDFLFWFRSATAEEIKWGGAKHQPRDEDDGSKMNPRSSFKAFLEVVKSKSLTWEISEINVIHSIQLIMRDSFQEVDDTSTRRMINAQKNVEIMQGVDEISLVASELIRLIDTANVPIFAVDSEGLINGWNAKMAELTRLSSVEAMGKSLVNDIIDVDSCQVVQNHLSQALKGEEDKNVDLKLRTFGEGKQNSAVFIVASICSSRDCTNTIIGACFVGQDVTREKVIMDKFIRLEGDYQAIIQSINPLIPPIFASDENACCSEWNAALERLTGWKREEVIGKMLVGEIFGRLCQLKGEETFTKLMVLLYQALGGEDTEKFLFGFYDRKGKYVEAFLTASKRTNMDENIIGCFCFLQTIVPEMQQTSEAQTQLQNCCTRKECTYIRQAMKNPLNGIRYTHKLLEDTGVSDFQKQFLEISDACERQMMTIIDETELVSIDVGSVELNMEEFVLRNALDAVISQIMISLTEKKLHLICEIPEEVRTLCVYGDQIRLQQVLSDFMLTIVNHAPSPDGWVAIEVAHFSRLMKDGFEVMHLQFRMSHSGQGLPSTMVQDMVGTGTNWATEEGHGLSLLGKLLKMMNGHVRYLCETNKCYFLVDIELQSNKKRSEGADLDVNKPT